MAKAQKERILALGGRAVRRQFVATDRGQSQRVQVLDYIKTWPLTVDRAAKGRRLWSGAAEGGMQ